MCTKLTDNHRFTPLISLPQFQATTYSIDTLTVGSDFLFKCPYKSIDYWGYSFDNNTFYLIGMNNPFDLRTIFVKQFSYEKCHFVIEREQLIRTIFIYKIYELLCLSIVARCSFKS